MAPSIASTPTATAPVGTRPWVWRPRNARLAWDESTDPLLWWDSAEPMLWYDRNDAADIADPIDPADAKEPTLPIEANEAALPIERTESWEQIDRIEFSDQRDHTSGSVVPTAVAAKVWQRRAAAHKATPPRLMGGLRGGVYADCPLVGASMGGGSRDCTISRRTTKDTRLGDSGSLVLRYWSVNFG